MTIALRQRPLARVVMGIVKSANGAWFDPSDLSTLYQDAAGTTPVTAVEQPVGLILDKSQGLVLGPELVVNGTFDSGIAGWEQKYNATTSYSLGSLKVMPATIDTNGAFAGQAIPTAIGRSYKVTFDLVTANAATYIRALNNINAPWAHTYGIAGAAVGNKITLVFTATATVTYIAFGVSGSGSLTNAAVYDNISVRELYGNHATQSVTASRPTLSARYNLLTKTEDMANSAWIKQAYGTASVPIVTNNYGIAPDGTMTASRIVYALNGGTTTTDRSLFGQSPVSIGTEYTSTVWIKSNTKQSYILQHRLGLGAQLITADQTWRKYSYTQTITDTTHWLSLRGGQGTSDSADILIWHPDLRVGSTADPYQRVNTSTDYDTDERYFPKYLRFDGVDDYLNLPYMGLYANGSASVVVAISSLPQSSATHILAERDTASTASAYILLRHELADMAVDSYIRNNASQVLLNGSNYTEVITPAGVTSVVDNGAVLSTFKNSNRISEQSYTRSGILTLVNTTVGASNNVVVSLYNMMNLYSLIITKSALTDAQRIKCERYAASKAGVIL